VAEQIEVSGDFFEALAISIVRGRQFHAADRGDSAPVAIVNETFARRQFKTLDVLGRRFKSGDPQSKSPWVTIVGVAADVPYANGVWGGAAQTVYMHYAQNLWTRSPYIVVKSGEDAGLLLGSIREVVKALDPSLPLRDVATMDERLRLSTLPARFRTWLAITLAGIALALAVTGIYGVMAYHVTQRHRETAIRRALGAREGQIIAEVMSSGLRLAGIGIIVGLIGAAAATRSLGTVLYQVNAQDPAMLLAGAA
jgi:putative ABC transport system permease protein